MNILSKRMIFTMATLVGVLGLTFASSALANGGVTFVDEKTSTSAVSISDKAVAKARLGAQGAIVLRWERPKGWKPKTTIKCIWVTGGENSYISKKTGRRVWVDWSGKRAYICPDRTSSTGWRKAGGPPTWENCGNEFIPPFVKKRVPLFKGKYVVEQTLNWTVTISAKASVVGTIRAQAICTGNGVFAQADAYGTGSASALVTFVGRGRTLVKATGAAQAGFNAQVIKQQVSLSGDAVASARLDMSARASVQCVSQPVPPVPPGCQVNCTPPPTPPPPVTTTVKAITTHDVYSGGEVDLCGTITRSDGSKADPTAITISAPGNWEPKSNVFFVDGKWCQRFKVPATTVQYNVTYTIFAYGAQASNTMTVRPQNTGP